MGKGNAQLGETLEDTAENHRTDGERSFRRHPHQPWQPVIWHSFFAHHVPGMDEDCRAVFFRCAPDRLERPVIEIERVEPA